MAALAAPALEQRSRTLARVLGCVALAGAAAAGLTVWSLARSPVLVAPGSTGLLRGLYVALMIGVGTYTWWRRPHARLGLLVTGIGFVYALTSLNGSGDEVTYTLGMLALGVFSVYLPYVYLAFPRDALGSRLERTVIGGFAGVSALLWTVVVVFSNRLPRGGPFADCGSECPGNGLQAVETSARVSRGLVDLLTAALAVGFLATAIVLFVNLRSASHLRRRAVEPLAYIFVASAIANALSVALVPSHPEARTPVRAVVAAFALAAPIAILVGQIRGSFFAGRTLRDLVATIGGEPMTLARVEAILRGALGDPTLVVALWSPDRRTYVAAGGDAVDLPSDTHEREVTRIDQAGRPVAALIHDPGLESGEEMVEGLTATSLMLLENTRLVDELQASRARIVATAQHERLRLERDLHDGAQQRLMAIQIKLALARDRAESSEITAQLEEIEDDATAAVEELRVLAHGIYPPVLSERGLPDAFRAFARSAPLPIRIVDQGVGRSTPEIETAVYFCGLEAVQNAGKHGGPGTRVTITVGRRTTGISLEVMDDGRGFDPDSATPGIGLTSMRDRIGAVGGELEIVTQPGLGTNVHAFVPTPES